MWETEEGRTDHHHGRANRTKRGGTGSAKWRRARSTKRRRPNRAKTVTKEKAPPGEAEGMESEFLRKAERTEGKSRAVKVVMRAKELLVEEMLLMAESPEMTHSRMAKVAQSALEAACMATHVKSADPMSPGRCSKEHRDRKDEQCCSDLFHISRPPEKASCPPKPQKGRGKRKGAVRGPGTTN